MKLYGKRWHGCRVDEFTWRGQRLIVLENELLHVGVLASKGADIIEFRYKPRDLDVMWHSPHSLLPGDFIPTSARPAGAFLDYYPGGWQEVFPSAGPETVIAGAELGQHGETPLLPWDVHVRQDTASRLEVDFIVETVRMPFRLRRRMILSTGSPALRLEEEAINLGEQELPYAWGHHPAFGPPFLEAGCRIEMPACEVVEPPYAEALTRRFAVGQPSRFPLLADLRGDRKPMNEVPSPASHTQDVVVASQLTGNWCALRNPARKLAVGLVWDTAVFPYLWMWQVYGGAFGYPYYGRTYNLALEPFNGPVEPLANLADQGRARVLGPGQSVTAVLECGIFEAPGEVQGVEYGGRLRTG